MSSETETNRLNGLVWFYALSVLIAVLDRLTKVASDANLVAGQPVQVFPGVDLLLGYNTGAAFSFLSEAGGWQRWFLTTISLVVSIVLVIWLAKLQKSQRLQGLALACILGGAVGNLYDRMFAGYVIDFISVYFREWRFATFNIADAAISIGAGLMVLDILLDWKNSGTSEKSGSD